MILLLLSVLCSVIIANLLMVFNRARKQELLTIFLGNYFMATLFSFVAIPENAIPPSGFDLGLGLLAGLLFLANFFIYQKNIVSNGLSLSVSVMRIAVIIPIMLSLFVFRERISPVNIAGIVIALTAFGLKSDLKDFHTLFWLGALFLVSGATESTLKLFKELGGGSEQGFVFVIFLSAFFFTMGAILYKRIKVSWLGLGFGFALGVPNRLSTVFFLQGLNTVPAAIAFPFTAIGVVLLSIISDTLIWRRRPTLKEGLLYCLLALSILLLNL